MSEQNKLPSDVIGYNKKEIEGLVVDINRALEKTSNIIIELLQDNIIKPMSLAWYAPEAVDFFENFKTEVASKAIIINDAYDKYRKELQAAGEIWADNSGGERPVIPELKQIELNLNITSIQSEDNGNIVLDASEASKVIMNLSVLEEELNSKVASIARELDFNTSFIGHGQSQAILNCFTTVSNQIHDVFKSLTEGDNALYNRINEIVHKYQDAVTNVVESFSSQGKEEI